MYSNKQMSKEYEQAIKYTHTHKLKIDQENVFSSIFSASEIDPDSINEFYLADLF